jgi:hypothetical protein
MYEHMHINLLFALLLLFVFSAVEDLGFEDTDREVWLTNHPPFPPTAPFFIGYHPTVW